MVNRYRSGWAYGNPTNGGELTSIGADFIAVIARLTAIELNETLETAFRRYIDFPPTLSQLDAIAVDVIRRRPTEPTPPPSANKRLSGGWIERVVRGCSFVGEMRQHCRQNPQWEKQPGETSLEYGARMAGECAKIDPRLGALLARRRKNGE